MGTPMIRYLMNLLRTLAKVIGINRQTPQDANVYDFACGSGSLLLKASDEAGAKGLTIYRQEMDNATSALVRMNMILHDNPTAKIWKGNTLADPQWKAARIRENLLNGYIKGIICLPANLFYDNGFPACASKTSTRSSITAQYTNAVVVNDISIMLPACFPLIGSTTVFTMLNQLRHH